MTAPGEQGLDNGILLGVAEADMAAPGRMILWRDQGQFLAWTFLRHQLDEQIGQG